MDTRSAAVNHRTGLHFDYSDHAADSSVRNSKGLQQEQEGILDKDNQKDLMEYSM